MSDSFKQSDKLDLGLTTLLASAEEVDISEDLSLLASKRLTTGSSNGSHSYGADPAACPSVVDPYDFLAKRGAWTELLHFCETELEENAADVRAKLWWIRAQLALGQMPVSILAAPLEPVVDRVLEMRAKGKHSAKVGGVCNLAEEVLSEVADALEKNGELELSLAFWEKAFRFNPQYKAQLFGVIEAGLGKCSEQRGAAHRRENLRFKERLLDLKKELSAGHKEASISVGAAKGEKGELRKSSRLAGPLFYLTLIGAAALVVGVGLRFLSTEVGPLKPRVVEAVKEPAVYAGSRPALRLPTINRTGSPNLQSLMGILYALDKSERAGSAPGEAPAAPQNSSSKHIINTSSPVEPEEVRLIFERGLNPSQSSTWHAGPYRKPMVRGHSWRDPIVAGDLVPGARAPKFVQSESVFTMLTPTVVLAQPSDSAFEIGRLKKGDQVRVVESMGRWLKVLSRAGREGYIPAESARLR
ncbi:MAG: SH3 domain-containing protein [Deltaproteobacteria bacterium]|nr:SH3 domain-containing protein [Deltaproteobacteria bacterium]